MCSIWLKWAHQAKIKMLCNTHIMSCIQQRKIPYSTTTWEVLTTPTTKCGRMLLTVELTTTREKQKADLLIKRLSLLEQWKNREDPSKSNNASQLSNSKNLWDPYQAKLISSNYWVWWPKMRYSSSFCVKDWFAIVMTSIRLMLSDYLISMLNVRSQLGILPKHWSTMCASTKESVMWELSISWWTICLNTQSFVRFSYQNHKKCLLNLPLKNLKIWRANSVTTSASITWQENCMLKLGSTFCNQRQERTRWRVIWWGIMHLRWVRHSDSWLEVAMRSLGTTW